MKKFPLVFFIGGCLLSLFITQPLAWSSPTLSPALKKYCQKMEDKFVLYGWGKSRCLEYSWEHVRNSNLGLPLAWYVYGKENPPSDNQDTTLVLCGVHGDEITPIKFCYDILVYLKDQFATQYADKLIVVAPLVNPDSFFKKKPTRTNHHGVDINRNFPTKDWGKSAKNLWVNVQGKDKRRFPGDKPLSEPEVLFQINLIKRYRPDKIITVHAPLTMLDYDGPESHEGYIPPTGNAPKKPVNGHLASELLLQMSKSAEGYRIRNFRTYPGSLGNWAGVERKIPTYTLELPTSDPSASGSYWNLLKTAIHNAFVSDLKKQSEKFSKSKLEKGNKKVAETRPPTPSLSEGRL